MFSFPSFLFSYEFLVATILVIYLSIMVVLFILYRSHEVQLSLILGLIVCWFVFLAKLDYVLGERERVAGLQYHLQWVTVGSHWFWLWIVGYPLIAFTLALVYYAGAEDTETNFWYTFGIFMTVILLAVGQLEDFFYHVINGVSFLPWSEPWSRWQEGWNAENNIYWKLAGTWNSQMHLIWLGCFIAITVAMWIAILKWG